MTTPIQHLQALSIIANDGVMIKPRIEDKIVDSQTGNTIYQNEIEKIQVASKENVEYIRELMYNVVNSTKPGVTGYKYKIPGYDVIGKTGTAQYFNSTTGKYSGSGLDYIYSFSGMFPKDNPDVIIFASLKKPTQKREIFQAGIVSLMKDIATYRNTFNKQKSLNTSYSYVLNDYRGQKTEDIKNFLKEKDLDVILIGNGKYIIDQYPESNITVLDEDHIFLITNGSEFTIPNFIGWSKKDVQTFANLTGIEIEFDGYGYVFEQSIKANEVLKEKEKIQIKLKDKEI